MEKRKMREITDLIETLASRDYQESYDNSGWQVGDPEAMATGALICLEVTEAIVEEAIQKGCNLIIAHHPLIFPSVKRILGQTEVERVLIRAIREGIHIYAAHTNLDNVRGGVNDKLADKLGLKNRRPLRPMKNSLGKIAVFVPPSHLETLRQAVFDAGAGNLGEYSECSYVSPGTGSFRPGQGARPFLGEAGGGREEVEEVRLEFVFPRHREKAVIQAMIGAHPYEEPAYDFLVLENAHGDLGAGLIGDLEESMESRDFLAFVQERLGTESIKYTPYSAAPILRVALCGGSGSFLISDALSAGAQAFLTADIKYHQFFASQGKILIADLGHYETERFTGEIFQELLKKKFPNFASLLTTLSTNPIKYFSNYGDR